MTDRLTALAWPAGKPPKPTAEDRAQAAAFVDGLIADKRLLPRDRADMIRSHAETVMGERMRAEQKSSQGMSSRPTNPTGEAGATNLPNHRRAA